MPHPYRVKGKFAKRPMPVDYAIADPHGIIARTDAEDDDNLPLTPEEEAEFFARPIVGWAEDDADVSPPLPRRLKLVLAVLAGALVTLAALYLGGW